MIKNRKIRRIVAMTLIVIGGLLMFFATEILAGVVMFGLGIVLELFGIKLEHEKD